MLSVTRRFAGIALLGAMSFLLSIPAATTTAESSDRIQVENILGPWLTGKKGAVIDIYRCGNGNEELCGRIAWMKKPYTREGELKRDPKNPDPALRDRMMCGIEVFTGLERNDRNSWVHGHVYNPKDGNTYSAYLDAKDNGTVRIRGYLGIPLIGKSEIWTRPRDIDIGCPEE